MRVGEWYDILTDIGDIEEREETRTREGESYGDMLNGGIMAARGRYR